MDTKDIENLVSKLLQKTKQKEMQWGPTNRKTEYIAKLDSGSVTSDTWSHNGKENSEVVVYNANGIPVFTLRQTRGEGIFATLASLTNAARENYYRADETIAKLLAELDKAGPVGSEPPKPPPEEDVPF